MSDEPIELENIFDPDPAPEPPPSIVGQFGAEIAGAIKTLYTDMMPEPIEVEHKVRIIRFNDRMIIADVEAEIAAILADGWRIGFPYTCGDFAIFTFSKTKERKTTNDN